MCINKYRVLTPGLYACINACFLIKGQVLNPDFLVMINAGPNKQCNVDYEKNLFVGPPNFILEIHEDLNSDYLQKRKHLFASSGVQEYLIVNESTTTVEWNRLVGDHFEQINPDEDGIIKSTSLPGLWISVNAIINNDLFTIMACIEHGVTRNEHHKLMQGIWKK